MLGGWKETKKKDITVSGCFKFTSFSVNEYANDTEGNLHFVYASIMQTRGFCQGTNLTGRQPSLLQQHFFGSENCRVKAKFIGNQ